jgi:putative tryptophan/tyrosine transport system substrate-binding protein
MTDWKSTRREPSTADRMRRRELLSLLAGAVTAPRTLRAQQKAMPVIGFLSSGSPGPTAPYVAAFRQGLSESNYLEGKIVAIEYRWAEDHYDRLPALAADLVSRKVNVIATGGGISAARAAKNASSTIPIVFLAISDPVEDGLVASLARPGGNVTGLGVITRELTPKRFELLSELVPETRAMAMLVNPNNAKSALMIQDAQGAARAKGVRLHILEAGAEGEFDAAFASLLPLQVGALVLSNDPFFNSRRDVLVALAARHAIPAIYEWREFVTAGGLISYGPSLTNSSRQAGGLRQSHPQRRQAGRSAGSATDHLRARNQPRDRQGARPHHPAVDPRPRR